MMPFVDAFFLPRNGTDRPKVIPDGMTNFAFLGQFAEAGTRDVIFTVEYSVRTAMEAVYTVLDIERGVPEVWGSIYDVRQLIKSTAILRDHKPIPVPAIFRKFIEKNELGRMLAQFGAIADADHQPVPTGAITPKGS